MFLESLNVLNNYSFSKAKKKIDNYPTKNTIEYYFLKSQLNFKEKDLDSVQKILLHLNNGDLNLYNHFGKNNNAFENYSKSHKLALLKKDTVLICETSKRLISYLIKFNRDPAITLRYLNTYKKYLYNDLENDIYKNNKLIYKIQLFRKLKDSSLIPSNSDFSNAIHSISNPIIKANIFHLQGVTNASIRKKFKTSIKYYNKAFSIYNKFKKNAFIDHKIFNYYLSLGAINYSLKEYEKALLHLKKCETIPLISNKKRDVISLYNWMYKVYFASKDYKNAFLYFKKSKSLNDKIKQIETNIKIEDIHVKHQTAEKEKENLQLKQKNSAIEAKRKQNLYSLVTSISVLILGIVIGTLTLKNSKRKRKLAEQQKELETQKNLTLLKEQEITTINAMVDGQEKERKRIAEDLHDNLGSVLATLKLHFENLKINREKKKINQEELFNKTENLIDEAYLKVRRIAHAKNAGVIANQGLLLAVQMMAEKISSADKIEIEVIHFGLDKPLENNLEITVFRIIQELVTNILKHAEATKATVNISLYNKNLNIIIEDNGNGFDIKKINFMNGGMGLSSIKTRIEHLQGSFEIDATIGKGSSMIIDIPL